MIRKVRFERIGLAYLESRKHPKCAEVLENTSFIVLRCGNALFHSVNPASFSSQFTSYEPISGNWNLLPHKICGETNNSPVYFVSQPTSSCSNRFFVPKTFLKHFRHSFSDAWCQKTWSQRAGVCCTSSLYKCCSEWS